MTIRTAATIVGHAPSPRLVLREHALDALLAVSRALGAPWEASVTSEDDGPPVLVLGIARGSLGSASCLLVPGDHLFVVEVVSEVLVRLPPCLLREVAASLGSRDARLLGRPLP